MARRFVMGTASRAAALALLLGACGRRDARELRGRAERSADGRTYLVVADANGGRCGPVSVDGRPWPHAVGAPGPVSPGRHTIACGTEVEVQVDSGTTFRLDYWGP